jgi:probable F420-dependent oxidoreductase
MELGIVTFPTEHSLLPAELAAAAEQRGFESLWFCEHSHIPVRRESPWPGGGELPRHYLETLDPVVAIAAAASVTSRLRLGTAVALIVERDPIHFAKSIASLDVVSGGRIEVGLGAGWNLEEMRNHGTDPSTRFALMRERIEAMKAIWADDEASYHGEHVDFDPIYAWPKPVQRPHPPLHIGGAFPGGLRRAVRYGDGWMPLGGRDDTDFAPLARALREEAERAGRDPASLQMTVCFAPADAAVLSRMADAGVDRALIGIPHEREAALAALEERAPLLDAVAG